MKRSAINKALNKIPTHFFIIFTMVVWLVPTIGLLITSFRPLPLINTTGWWTFLSVNREQNESAAGSEKLSDHFTLNNYIDAVVGYRGTKTYVADCASGSQSVSLKCNLSDFLSPRGMGRAFVNSLLVTIPATILPVFFAAFAGYAFAWLDFKGRYLIFAILVGLQVVPLQMTLVPVLKMYASLGMTGTFLGVWLFHTGFGLPYAIYLMRNFLGGLPRDLFEAAYLDGASHWTTFTNLVIPLAMPAIASLGIYQFLWVWNDLLVALVFLGGTKPVMTYQISNMVTSLEIGRAHV